MNSCFAHPPHTHTQRKTYEYCTESIPSQCTFVCGSLKCRGLKNVPYFCLFFALKKIKERVRNSPTCKKGLSCTQLHVHELFTPQDFVWQPFAFISETNIRQNPGKMPNIYRTMVFVSGQICFIWVCAKWVPKLWILSQKSKNFVSPQRSMQKQTPLELCGKSIFWEFLSALNKTHN